MQSEKKWKKNTIYILILLLLNPVVFLMHNRYGFIFPDSITYMMMGKDLLADGMLYLQHWGHVDGGVVLPLLYPFFIGIGRVFLDDGFIVAELVSSVCIILSSIPLFFYISRLTNREMALATVLLIQLNYYYLYFGTLALTEATFIFALCVGLWVAQRSFYATKLEKLTAFSLGIISALVFFSRQIGLIFFIVVISIWIFRSITERNQQRKKSLGTVLYITLGFSLLIVPYGMALYSQTGQSILTQHFRMGDYVVTQAQATQVIQQQGDLDLLNKLTPSSTGKETYEEIYIQRRVMRELLPDSSEMYSHVAKDSQEGRSIAESVWDKFRNKPSLVTRNLTKNFSYLKEPIGNILPYLFLVTFFSAFLLKIENKNTYARRLLPTLIVIYLIVLSFFSGVVDRYVQVIFGLVLVHIMVEVYLIVDRFLLVNVSNKQRMLGTLFLFSFEAS